MHLHLIDHRGLTLQMVQVLRLEVRHADGAGQPLRLELLQGVPCLDVGIAVLDGGRPVDEVQVDVVQTELLQTRLDGLAGILGLVGVVPQLGGDEKPVTGDAGAGDGPPDAFLVAIDGGGVDVAVARLKGAGHGLLGLVVRHLPGAESQLGDGGAVIEGDGGNAHGSSSWVGDRVRGRSQVTT